MTDHERWLNELASAVRNWDGRPLSLSSGIYQLTKKADLRGRDPELWRSLRGCVTRGEATAQVVAALAQFCGEEPPLRTVFDEAVFGDSDSGEASEASSVQDSAVKHRPDGDGWQAHVEGLQEPEVPDA